MLPKRRYTRENQLGRYVTALYDVLSNVLGADKVVLRAGKLGALKLMRSHAVADRVVALQRLVFEDPTFERMTSPSQVRRAVNEIEDGLADLIAQKNVEDSIERKINEKMSERHQEYLKDLKLEA
ncbi:MAG: ATP-dependent protease, Lon family, partial [Candidatus Eremiobacteraeota bacterium]|nr:ATP-dependent protease, Lon family [Candidatus Eremiobacteraeota bacterium]